MPAKLAGLCEDARIHVRVVPHYNAVRILTAHLNCQTDIAALVKALDKLHDSRESGARLVAAFPGRWLAAVQMSSGNHRDQQGEQRSWVATLSDG